MSDNGYWISDVCNSRWNSRKAAVPTADIGSRITDIRYLKQPMSDIRYRISETALITADGTADRTAVPTADNGSRISDIRYLKQPMEQPKETEEQPYRQPISDI